MKKTREEELAEALRAIVLAEFGTLNHPQIPHSRLWKRAVDALNAKSEPRQKSKEKQD